MDRKAWLWIAIGAAVVAGVWWKLGENKAPTGSNVIPAQDDADEGLAIGTSVEHVGAAREVTLRLGAGVALLTLDDARDTGDSEIPMAFGHATITAPDPIKGAAFLAGIARWLDVPVPASRADPTPLAPVRISYVRLAKSSAGKPEAMKLFLQTRKLEAEVYLNLWSNGERATFLEKDEDYRHDMIAFLALVLRDGPAPKRSMKNDPSFASDAPLVAELSPLAGGEEADHFVFAADGSLYGSRGATLVKWAEVAGPPADVATFDEEVLDIKPTPHGSLMAITTTKPAHPGSYSSDDPEWVHLWNTSTSTKTPLAGPSDHPGIAVFSPNGNSIALSVRDGAGRGSHAIVKVYDVVSSRLIAATAPDLDVLPSRWTPDGLFVRRFDFGTDAGSSYLTYGWHPGKSDPIKALPESSALSPDGKLIVTIDKDKIRLTPKAGGAARIFESSREDDRDAISGLADESISFLGARGLLLQTEETLVLDCETLKLQRLLAREDVTLKATSPDGRALVVVGEDHKPLIGRLP